MEDSRSDLLVTCRLGMEKVVASFIRELDPSAVITPSPEGFSGLVFVKGASDGVRLYEEIKRSIPEVEKVFIVECECEASLAAIVDCAKKLAGEICSGESFAVKTVRRGEHSFTSLDVNVAVGSEIKELTDARVDLENPDKVLLVQILKDRAYLSIVPGREFYRKMGPGKYPMYKIFRKLVVAHEPYLGPPDAAYVMGTRIGREVQVFEVGKLFLTPLGPVEAQPFYHFLRGLFEGLRSRHELQKKSYGREVHRTQVYVQDMYQFVRARMGSPLIVFEPEGEPVSRVAGKLSSFILENLRMGKEIVLMVGAREGVPSGLFRYADFVIDLVPGVVLSTEYALSSALIAVTTIMHEALASEYKEETFYTSESSE
ncbi:MAG: SPOUT family RNA methylase [Thermofilaceae archaeon]|nr:SPOUT family RNA methylase [Thermofilaceae archaeon]